MARTPTETTGHIALTLGVVLGMVLASVASAVPVELDVTTSNDLVSGNDRADDLYTAELELGLRFGRAQVSLGERMFTDREAGVRHDETYLDVGVALPELAEWQIGVGVGLLRVGQGLAGQRVQNAIHRTVGSDRVDLAYEDDPRWFGSLEMTLDRAVAGPGRMDLVQHFELRTTPGFRSWLRAGVAVERDLGEVVTLRAGVGFMANQVQADELREHVRGLGLTWEMGIAYRRAVLRWTTNDFGTGAGHVTLGVRIGGGRGGGGGR